MASFHIVGQHQMNASTKTDDEALRNEAGVTGHAPRVGQGDEAGRGNLGEFTTAVLSLIKFVG